MKCALCYNPAMRQSRLCDTCNEDRLVAASAARIHTGMTWENASEFSEENWIRTHSAGEPRGDRDLISMFKITVVHIPNGNVDLASTTPAALNERLNPMEVYSQTFDEINLPALIKALNPSTRKRRGKKEVAP